MECRPKVVPKNKARKKVANPENWKQNKAKKRRLVANSDRVVQSRRLLIIVAVGILLCIWCCLRIVK